MPVLSRYIVREIVLQFGGIVAVVLAIFLIRRFSGLLSDAAEGSLPPDVILHLLSLRTVMALPSLLPVVLYLAVLLGLGRLHQDHEIVAAEACGVSPLRVVRTATLCAAFFAVVTGILALSVRPWAAERFTEAREQALRVLNVGGLLPGRFYEIGPRGKQILFAERRATDGAMEDVFVQSREGEKISILFSQRATEQLDLDSGFRFLTLREGHRYDVRPDREEYEITQYREFVVRTAIKEGPLTERQERTDSTAQLLRSDRAEDVAELQWRLAMPVSTLLLGLLAVPLSRVDPRRGKYGKLFVAILIYLVYRQVLGAAKDWVAHETLAAYPGVWAVHGILLVIVLLLLAREPVQRRWQRARRSASGRRTGAPGAGRSPDEAV